MSTTPITALPILDQLRAAAHLYGIDTPEVDQARVLCIGVGSEPGLASFALTHPQATVLNVSIGDDAPSFVGAMPENLHFLATSLDQIDARLGSFDYILVPSLYGYLPSEATTYLLQTCESLLSPAGLVCIGYPSYPGAKVLEIVRDAVLLHLHDAAASDSQTLLGQALAALNLFEDGLASANPLAPALREAASILKADIQRGHLELILNGPAVTGLYFVEFAQLALQVGLASVGDVRPQLDVPRHWGDSVRTVNSLLGLGQSEATRLQYLDFASGRGQRHTLLVHTDRGTGIRALPDLDRLGDLRWAGYWEPEDWRSTHVGQRYRNHQGRQWEITSLNDARLLEVLAAHWPRSISISQWASAAGLSPDDVLVFVRPLFTADMLHYCLNSGPCDALESGRLYAVPGLGQQSVSTDGKEHHHGDSGPVLTTQWTFWGDTVQLPLTHFEQEFLGPKNGAIDLGIFLGNTFHGAQSDTYDLSSMMRAHETLQSGLLSKLWKSGLLVGSKATWRTLLEGVLNANCGKSACWSLYIQATMAEDAPNGVPIVLGTPREQAQLDHLQRLLDELAYVQAESLARQATERQPARIEGWVALVRSLSNQGRHDDSLDVLNQVRDRFRFDPVYIEHLAIALSLANCNDEAIRVGRLALYHRPTSGALYNALGLACLHSARVAVAKQYFTQGMVADPGFHALGVNLVSVYTRQGKIREGISLCRELLSRPGANNDYRAAIYHNLLFFSNYDPDRSAAQIFQDYQSFERELCQPFYKGWKAHRNSRNPNRKLKIGYVSADFTEHAVSRFLEPIFSHHNKSEFEIYGYANMRVEDSATVRYRKLADHWVSLYGMKDDEAAQRIRDDGIDILVDLSGHTGGHRLGVFARKPAPVSLTWLGYGYTTGVSAIDYFLCNEALCPEGSESIFAESLWRLKGSWVVYQPHWGEMPESNPLPALEEGCITFISLSRIVRINERVIRVWAKILAAVPGSRLVLNSMDFADQENCAWLLEKFLEHGIGANQLMMGYTSPPWHSLRHADIGLDCFPHNAGTTLLDMLCVGVPYVTLADRPSVGRIGSAPLHSLGYTEWIASSEAEYVEKAVALASDTAALATIRQTLPSRFRDSDLVNQEAFVTKLEAAYREMFLTWSVKR